MARRLRAGEVCLRKRCLSGGTIFGVSNRGSAKQREVWQGRDASRACLKPFRPPGLCAPSAVTAIVLREGKLLRVSKRDARSWFDQLSLPSELVEHMARPPVLLGDLVSIAGMSFFSEVSALCSLQGNEAPLGNTAGPSHDPLRQRWFPCSLVWPMGFAWSSFVAPGKLLDVCRASGLSDEQLLSTDVAVPACVRLCHGVATDDLMAFSTAGPGAASKAAGTFDRVSITHVGYWQPSEDRERRVGRHLRWHLP